MIYKFFFIAALGASLVACQSTAPKESANASDSLTLAMDTTHNSQNSLDWAGEYEATLPCADCPGIKTQLTLLQDSTFTLHSEYLEKNTHTDEKGTLMWHDQGSVIHLNGAETNLKFKVGENQLFLLDTAGQVDSGIHKEAYTFIKK